jgi:hypothetical protein
MTTPDRTAQTAAVLPVAVVAVVAGLTQLVWLGVTWRTVLAAVLLLVAVWCRWRSAETSEPDEARATQPGTPWDRIGWAAACGFLVLLGLALVVWEASTRM